MQIQYGVGSVTGSRHRIDGINRQDFYKLIRTPDRFVFVMTDGMSLIDTGQEFLPTNSEYGAIFGANIISKATYDLSLQVRSREFDVYKSRPFWDRLEEDVLAHMRTNALLFGGNFQETILKFFMFTTLGVIIAPNISVFFAIGDGNFFVNDERIHLGPFKDNRPPFLAHRFVPPEINSAPVHFNVCKIIPTKDLKTFFVGTDGTDYIIDNEKMPLPGRKDLVGNINQFWKDDRFFANPAAVELRLRMIGDERQQIDWEKEKLVKFPGLLMDDTTLLTGRVQS